MYITVKKARLYPNKDTRELLDRTFGCCRFVYNRLLAESIDNYAKWKYYIIQDHAYPKPKVDIYTFSARLTQLKQEFTFLNEVSSVALQQSVKNLSIAYQRFFKGNGFPKFKRRFQRDAFRIVTDCSIRVEDTGVYLPKTKHLTRFYPSYENDNYISSYSVIKDKVGDYFINLLTTEQHKEKVKGLGCVGIDLGITSLGIVRDKEGSTYTIPNNRYYTRYQKQRTKLARRLAKKQKGSNNRNKARVKLAKLERAIANCRKDYLHKASAKLINENQVICLEDLNVKGMLRNGKLAKHIQDCGWGTFTSFLEYKAKQFLPNRNIVYIDRYYPSSQTCSCCKTRLEVKLKLSARHWTCPACNTKHDRDENAAFNILHQGLKQLA